MQKNIKLLKVLAFPVSAWFAFTIGTSVIQAEETTNAIEVSNVEEMNEGENNKESTNVEISSSTEDGENGEEIEEVEKKEDVSYSTHVQDVGWQEEKNNGETSGTVGEAKRLEAISIKLDNQSDYVGDIIYQTHVQYIGWQDWKKNGEIAGTTGQSLRLEAICIQLTDEWNALYTVIYRVHCQDYGWLDWVENGEIAGTVGQGKRLEGIEIKLLKKSEIDPSVSYKTHIQDQGWESTNKKDGQVSGTTGSSKRLEAIEVKLNDSKYEGSIAYKTHIQNQGWESEWHQDNDVSGTIGQSLRLEAIQIKLLGEIADYYDVYYRVHCQDYGWLGWAKNGESAGTEGLNYRLEAIEIQLVKKLENAPGSTDQRFIKEAVYTISDGTETVRQYKKNNKYYLFLKNTFDLSKSVITSDVDLLSTSYGLIENGHSIVGDFTNLGSLVIKTISNFVNTIEIIQSEVPSLNITLNDSVTLDDVNIGSKDIKYKSTLTIMGSEDESYNLTDVDIELKGRGNTSWTYPKRGYQIKLDKKQNLLGIGNGKSKKWVLLANYMDDTLLKNKFMYDLCVNSGLSSIPNSAFVDLYVNGEYIGNYLLCDKIEVGKDRVNLKNEDGVLVEMDFAYYVQEEYNFASSVTGNRFVIKEFGNDDMNDADKLNAMNAFKISIENLEEKLNQEASWNVISSLIDVDSFVKYYLVNEFAGNFDTFISSTYFYQDGKNGLIHMGPIWDYDKDNFMTDAKSDFTLYTNMHNYMVQLHKYPQFAQKIDQFYNEILKFTLEEENIKEYESYITNSSRINSIVWNSESTYESSLQQLNDWIEQRKDYYAQRYGSEDYNIYYSTHVENDGWLYASGSAQTNGTIGESKRIEAIRIYGVDEEGKDLSLIYQTHIQDIGWQDWKKNGEVTGTTGQAKQLEAIRIKLTDDSAEKYDVYYRVHCQDIGWTPWSENGETAGTVGLGKRLEAIEIKLVKKENTTEV